MTQLWDTVSAIYMEVFQIAENKNLVVDLLSRCGYSLLTKNTDAPNYSFVHQN